MSNAREFGLVLPLALLTAGGLSATLPKVGPTLRCRLDSDLAVHGRSDPLCAAEITLGGLHRDVAEEKLNLFQLAPSGAAEAGTTSPEIMGREPADANLIGELLDDVPDQLFRHSFAPDPASAAESAKKTPHGNSGGRCPGIQ